MFKELSLNKELSKKLCKNYPELYSGKSRDPSGLKDPDMTRSASFRKTGTFSPLNKAQENSAISYSYQGGEMPRSTGKKGSLQAFGAEEAGFECDQSYSPSFTRVAAGDQSLQTSNHKNLLSEKRGAYECENIFGLNQNTSMESGYQLLTLEKKPMDVSNSSQDKRQLYPLIGNSHNGSEEDSNLKNFESFSKNYLTFKIEGKENMDGNAFKGKPQQTGVSVQRKQEQQRVRASSTNNYVDRYLNIIKKRRKESATKKEETTSGHKKKSMFDDIRSQAIQRVHKQLY
jgi:hypothetical protein